MAPAPRGASASPADPEWLALRRKHEVELKGFQEEVGRSKVLLEQKALELQRRIEVAQIDLLTRHAEHEKEFWGKKNATSTPKTNISNGRDQTKNQITAALAKTTNANPKPTTAKVQRAQQNVSIKSLKPSQSGSRFYIKPPSLPINRPTHKKSGEPEIIDLCDSDDDDTPAPTQTKTTPAATNIQERRSCISSSKPVGSVEPASVQEPLPEFSIPSASLQLFGSSSKTFPTSTELPRAKREESVQSLQVCNSPPPASNDSVSNRESTAAPFQQAFRQHWSGNTTLGSKSFACGPFPRAFGQRPVTATPMLQPSPFPPSILSGATREGDRATPEGPVARTFLRAEHEKSNGDTEMGGMSQTVSQSKPDQPSTPNRNTHTPAANYSSTSEPATPINNASRNHLPSPAISMLKPMTPPEVPRASFQKPILPASASQPEFRDQNNSSVSSGASSHTLPTTPIRQCETPAPSQVTSSSGKKRKIEIDISSDESEFAPSAHSDDDEPVTPSRKRTTSGNVAKKQAIPTLKKPKCSTDSVAQVARKFGFKPVKNPAEAAKTRIRTSGVNGVSSAPSSRPMTQPTTSSSLRQSSRATRTAALKANEKLSQISSNAEEFWTEQSIAEAEEQEARLKDLSGTVNERVAKRFRSMSITPAPAPVSSSPRRTRDSGVDKLVNRETMTARQDWETWTQERANGDRILAKKMPKTQPTVEDYDSDLDGQYDIASDARWRTWSHRPGAAK